MVNCELLAVTAVEHAQTRVVQDMQLNTVVEVLKVLLLFGNIILRDALKHLWGGLLPKEAFVEQQHPEMFVVPDRVIM
jgi:hypothetical protein